MKINRMLLVMVMIAFSLALASSVLVPTTAANYGDTFNIEVKLIKHKLFSDDNWFQFPEDYQLNVSNSSLICPSNNCKSNLKFENGSTSTLVLEEGTNSMVIIGDFRLVDDQSNGHLTPKKQNLIEQMTYDWGCQFSDIQEDTKSKTTKYICSNPDNEIIIRKFNSTYYPYKITASFELPSRHLVLNATETHGQTLYSSGHTVFRNADGKIEVK